MRSPLLLFCSLLLWGGEVLGQCTVTINTPGTTPCLGDTLALTTNSNTANGPLVFSWTVTAGTGILATPNVANTLFSPGSPGVVTVQITATDTNGVTCTDTQIFTVTDASIAALTSTNTPPATQFNGLTTFSNCSPINSFNFAFQQQGVVFPGSSVTIDWGDNTADFTATGPWGTQNHLYNGAGLYVLTYTIDDGSCTDTQLYNVFIGVNPGAQFGRPDNSPVCDNDSVYFLITPDATNVPGTTYTIYYGDGQSDVFQHPPPAQVGYAYGGSSCNGAPYSVTCGGSTFPVAPAAGTFTACLCVENPCGGFPPTAPNIIVHQEAVASFPAPTSACVGQTVPLSSTSVGGINGAPCGTPYLTWSAQGPGTPSLISGTLGPYGTPQIQWQFPVPGTYDVELLAYGTAGVCEPDSITHPICIEPPLVPTFNHSNPGTCVPQAIALTNTTNLTNNCSVTWNWLVSASALSCGSTGTTTWSVGNANSMSPTLSVTQPGTYTVTLQATNSCGTVNSAPYVFTVADDPQVNFMGVLSLCAGDPVNPVANYITCGTPITSYLWTMPTGVPNSHNGPSPPNMTFTATGPITLTVGSACGPASVSGTVTVFPEPPASGIPPGPIQICQGQPLNLTATNNPNTTFVWTAPNGAIYNSATVNIPNAALIHDGIWSVVASLGPCPGPPSTVVVIVTPAPNVTANAAPPAFCMGGSTTLTANGAGNYVWDVNGTQVGTGSPLVVDTTLTLTYTVTGDVGGCPGTDDVLVTVNPLPVVNAGPDLVLCDQPIAVTLQPLTPGGTWDAPVVGGQFTPNGQGNFLIDYDYTDANGCFNSDQISITVGPPPLPVTAAPDTTICLNSGGLQLTATQANGLWSGTPWVNGSGVFTPGSVGVFAVNYVVGTGTCATDDDVTVEVVNGVTVNAGPDFAVCADDPPVPLNPNPASGVWSGSGLTPNDEFDPSLVLPGNFVLTYTYGDPNGCVILDNVNVLVNPLPTITQTDDTTFCDQPFAQQISYAPLGGTWVGPNVDNLGMYTPNGVTPINDPDTLIYTYTDLNGCTNSDTTLVTVIVPPFIAWAGNDTAACVGDPPFPLIGDGLGGDWSGSHVIPGYAFDPQVVGTFTLTYAVGSASCATQDQVDITVDPLPVLNIGIDTTVCVSDPPFTLWSSPAGGTWQATAYLSANGVFDPALAPLGIPSPCCYDYTDPVTECSNTSCRNLTVNGLPVVLIQDTIGCENDPLTFNNSSPSGPTWDWDFGDQVGTSTQQFPTYTYASAGTYTVWLIATSGAGCVDSASVVVSIAEIPLAQVDWNPIDTCGDGVVEALNLNVVPGADHLWAANGAMQSTGPQVGAFGLPGPVVGDTTYILTYDQSNYCGGTQDSFTVTLHPYPVASFGTDQLIYCLADTVFIGNDSYGLVDSVQWTLGDGSTSQEDDVVWYHQFMVDSTYVIIQEVYNECGADTATFTITVLPNQVTAFFNTDTVIGCAPLTATFTNFSDGDTASIWYFGDATNSTSISTNTAFTYTDPGIYTVTLVSLGCGIDTAYQQIEVLALPVVTTQNDTTICLGDPITFTASGAGIVGLVWDFGDGTFDSIPSPTHTYVAAGTYEVILSVISNITLCPSSDTINVTVVTAPIAAIVPSDSVLCAGESVDFNSTGSTGNNLIFSWTLDGTTFSLQSDPPPQVFNTPGTYTVALVIIDQLTDCWDSLAMQVVVNEMPVASFILDPVDPCGDPAQINATSTSSPVGVLTHWLIDGIYVGSGAAWQQSWNMPGQHSISVVAELPGCADTVTTPFVLHVLPEADFALGPACLNQPLAVTDLSVNAAAWWWYFNGTQVSTAQTTVSLVPTTLGADTISLAVSSAEGCRDSTWLVVAVHPTPEADMSVHVEEDCQTITLQATPVPLASYLWTVDGVPYSEETETVYLYDANTTTTVTIMLTVTSVDSCVDPVTRTVELPPCVFVPNTFTPNGDGNNDLFAPVILPAQRFKSFRIFNRWGEVIHEVNGTLIPWDGSYGGRPSPDGAYPWQVEYLDIGGAVVRRIGHVNLLR